MKRWYIVDRLTGVRIRGPYEHKETALAVKGELERYFPRQADALQVVGAAK